MGDRSSWFDAVPKRIVAAAFSGLVLIGSTLGATTISLLKMRIDAVEDNSDAPWKQKVAILAEEQAKLRVTVDQHERLITALDLRTQMTEVQGDVKILRNDIKLMNEKIDMLVRKGL